MDDDDNIDTIKSKLILEVFFSLINVAHQVRNFFDALKLKNLRYLIKSRGTSIIPS